MSELDKFYELIKEKDYLEAVNFLEVNPDAWKKMKIEELSNYFINFRRHVAPNDLISLATNIGDTIFGRDEAGYRNCTICF